jgi:hypothetical protein
MYTQSIRLHGVVFAHTNKFTLFSSSPVCFRISGHTNDVTAQTLNSLHKRSAAQNTSVDRFFANFSISVALMFIYRRYKFITADIHTLLGTKLKIKANVKLSLRFN